MGIEESGGGDVIEGVGSVVQADLVGEGEDVERIAAASASAAAGGERDTERIEIAWEGVVVVPGDVGHWDRERERERERGRVRDRGGKRGQGIAKGRDG